jgi:hypothetical protein
MHFIGTPLRLTTGGIRQVEKLPMNGETMAGLLTRIILPAART